MGLTELWSREDRFTMYISMKRERNEFVFIICIQILKAIYKGDIQISSAFSLVICLELNCPRQIVF